MRSLHLFLCHLCIDPPPISMPISCFLLTLDYIATSSSASSPSLHPVFLENSNSYFTLPCGFYFSFFLSPHLKCPPSTLTLLPYLKGHVNTYTLLCFLFKARCLYFFLLHLGSPLPFSLPNTHLYLLHFKAFAQQMLQEQSGQRRGGGGLCGHLCFVDYTYMGEEEREQERTTDGSTERQRQNGQMGE